MRLFPEKWVEMSEKWSRSEQRQRSRINAQ